MAEKDKKNKLLRRIQFSLKVITILFIAGIIVWLFPKTESFNYSYQKGMPWKYETLLAPFDFPIHKMDDEIKAEIDRLSKEQVPIFNFNSLVANSQIYQFSERLNEYKTLDNSIIINGIITKLEEIYEHGIILLPKELAEREIKSVTIVKANLAEEEDFNKIYTLKKAYSTLVDFIYTLKLPADITESIVGLNLTNYIKPNLEYDAPKTRLALENVIKNINTSLGMMRRGEIVISQNEMITQEKYNTLESLKKEYEQTLGSTSDQIRLGMSQLILTLIALISFSIFLYFKRKRLFYTNKDFYFLYCMFLLSILLASMTRFAGLNILAIPVLFFPIIVNILFGNRAALYLIIGTTLLSAYFAPDSYMFIFMQLSGGIVAMFSMKHLQRRGQLFLSVTLILLTYILVYGAFTLIQQGTFTIKDAFAAGLLFINALLLCLTYPVLYLVERLFGYTSEITLLEYSNPNHPVLRILTRKAPGTFQHSLMVANLAEEAIYHIGGSPLLARTGALYHDIGKIDNPVMYIENQTGGMNPHNNYDFDESAQIIIGHVSKGIELAKKYNLPESIIQFIRTHHGRSKVKYFYNSFKNKYPDREINEEAFTYPGPDPSTRECSVLMMADAVEAASRSLDVKNEENIRNLVNNIINSQLNDGRFNNADITFKDINTIKKVFTEMLINAYHARISYPEAKQK